MNKASAYFSMVSFLSRVTSKIFFYGDWMIKSTAIEDFIDSIKEFYKSRNDVFNLSNIHGISETSYIRF